MTLSNQSIFKIRYFLCGLTFLVILSCTDFKKNHAHQNTPDADIAKGKVLAATYCKSCHLLPDPSLLNSSSWATGVLPQMGPRLGIFYYGNKTYPSSKNDPAVAKNFYPEKPVISTQEWQYIIDYYTALAPDTLTQQKSNTVVKDGAQLFTVATPEYRRYLPTTTFVQIDTAFSPHRVMMADMATKKVYSFNNQLQLIDSIPALSPVVDLERNQTGFITCNIGVMNPNNGRYGSAAYIITDAKGKMKADSSIRFGNLARPVQITKADFNNDGQMDYLVCEYGNLAGALSWMENKGNGTFERHVIREVPGAIKAYVRDVNHDGLPDIWVLFAQGDESIFLFTNKGNGKFDQEQVLRFPSIYGSSYFEMADFNKDGKPDIVYTCGDNADYSVVLKPYHGVYIFLNDGTNHFKQAWFYPMHGCFKAIARDFDGDGNLDIAAISFFADYVKQPEETFIYLANKGNLDFQPYQIPGTSGGRWLTMDAGDLDGDGKTDLVLGNFSIAPSSIRSATNWKTGPPFIVLKNTMKK
ncbi:hypothetical protein BH11BAC5_BH11BAC5_21520 [soil metagenome]